MPAIKRILGEHLISEAPIHEDMRHNTDLIVLKMAAVRIGVRIRRPSYFVNPYYRDEFTIRAKRPSGEETELAKIISGWGDYLFYGFGADTPPDLLGWHIGDLKVFRLWFQREVCKRNGGLPGELQGNADNSSAFRVFRWDELPTSFVLGAKTKKILKPREVSCDPPRRPLVQMDLF
jgi:hypothetical protein